MRKGSLIDDVEIDYGIKGPPICFKNGEIRDLLKLGHANRNDVFFDVGSGWGQTIIIALMEFGVARAVGFEKEEDRLEKARRRREGWLKQRPDIKPKQWTLVNGDLEILFRKGKLKGESLEDATLIFYGLSTRHDILRAIRKAWKNKGGRRLLYYQNCLFPEIMPTDVDFPFFVSKFPFMRPKSQEEWLTRVSGKKDSSLYKGKPASSEELWDELSHDYDINGDQEDILNYKWRLRNSVKRGVESGSLVF